jgi:hypothetical protein
MIWFTSDHKIRTATLRHSRILYVTNLPDIFVQQLRMPRTATFGELIFIHALIRNSRHHG